MTDYLVPIAAAVFVWWFATGAILFLDGLPRRRMRSVTAVVGLFALGGIVAIALTLETRTVTGAYVAFLGAILVWGWHEMIFLAGAVTGPRPLPCPPGASGFARFRAATLAILWHEVALAVTAALFVWVSWGAQNWVAAATFGTLWIMRLSAKANLFAGVRNASEEFLPAHLAFLATYFRRARWNHVFPVSLVGGLGAFIFVAERIAAASGDPFALTGYLLVGAMLALALVEHAFMMAPVKLTWLWRWGFSSRAPMPARQVARAPRAASL